MASTPLPKTMKGVLIEKTGGVEVLQYKTDLPVPTPIEGEVLVKNDFIGINYIDTCLPSFHLLSVFTYTSQLFPFRAIPRSETRNPRP
jgi:NADPH:quinone reductase-like Zn-dependent oxidoreductase